MRELTPKERKHLREVADEFIEVMTETVNGYVILGDLDRLERMVLLMKMLSGYEVIEILKERGFGKEITELCKKALGKQS